MCITVLCVSLILIDVSWCVMDFHYFHCLLVFIDFAWMFIVVHWFPWLMLSFMDLHGFRWFSIDHVRKPISAAFGCLHQPSAALGGLEEHYDYPNKTKITDFYVTGSSITWFMITGPNVTGQSAITGSNSSVQWENLDQGHFNAITQPLEKLPWTSAH